MNNVEKEGEKRQQKSKLSVTFFTGLTWKMILVEKGKAKEEKHNVEYEYVRSFSLQSGVYKIGNNNNKKKEKPGTKNVSQRIG